MRRLCAIFVVCAIVTGLQPAMAEEGTAQSNASSSIETDIKVPKKKRVMTVMPILGGGLGWFNMTGNSGNASVYATNRPSFMAGALTDIHFGRWAIETGLVYQRESSRIEITSNNALAANGNLDGNVNLDYVGVPVMGKISLGVSRGVRFLAKAGVTPALLVGSAADFGEKPSYYSSAVSDSFTNLAWSSDNLRKFNVFGTAGGGASFALGGGRTLLTEIVYNRTLMAVNEYNSSYNEVYSQSVMFVLGMGFGIY